MVLVLMQQLDITVQEYVLLIQMAMVFVINSRLMGVMIQVLLTTQLMLLRTMALVFIQYLGVQISRLVTSIRWLI